MGIGLSKSRIVCLCSALLMANAGISDINIGPFFERDPERDFTAVRPFWSSTPTTEDFAWPLGTWHTNESQFWESVGNLWGQALFAAMKIFSGWAAVLGDMVA